ncbi:hypothetical protein RRF57_009638 [Xylaria bambusicola]|uniref:Uncharacterized protein n=1 Tax=Xylaria bambusicola TaxID=326684 RepID=A0AAN7UTT8_9PEZI
MPRHAPPLSPRTPRTPRHPSSRASRSSADWRQRCEITIHRILRKGFIVDYLHAHTSVMIGAELETGVILVISAGAKSIHGVEHTAPGISEGLKDIAKDGRKSPPKVEFVKARCRSLVMSWLSLELNSCVLHKN